MSPATSSGFEESTRAEELGTLRGRPKRYPAFENNLITRASLFCSPRGGHAVDNS